jgi:hypothetical protein
MSKNIESLILSYKYWSNKYTMSSHINDLQQKNITFKHLMEEVDKQMELPL